MPQRRLNFTNRKRLTREDVRISITEGPGGSTFDAEILGISNHGFPDGARVFVEAYRQTQYSRFDYGKVGLIRIPDDRSLRNFDSASGIRFRVKVVSGSVPIGILLAEIDGIRPRELEDDLGKRLSLLPVLFQDLGSKLWALDFAEQHVYLVINSSLFDPVSLARDSAFIALVYPAIIRLILVRILAEEEYRDIDDLDDWRCQWLNFALALPGVVKTIPDQNISSREDWVESVVEAFSRQHELLAHFDDHRKRGQS